MTHEPVYILIRTSARPKFFKNMMDSIKEQTYPNIVTIVHTDDDKDMYIEGDIILRSQRDITKGRGHYNLYCNKLLEAIPDGPGWYHFIDDDDMYAGPDVIERLVKHSKQDHINVARVQRWNNTVWPKSWGNQKSYQTECFFLHTDHKKKARWWDRTGGDHNYSKQLTAVLPINWIDNLLICKAQDGKGRGLRFDLGETSEKQEYMEKVKISTVGPRLQNEKWVKVKYKKRVSGRASQRGRVGQERVIPYRYAQRLQNLGKVEIVQEIK